jgi:hypothetical protein
MDRGTGSRQAERLRLVRFELEPFPALLPNCGRSLTDRL